MRCRQLLVPACSALVLFGDDDAGSRLEKEGGDVRERDWGGGRRGDDEATGKAGVRRGAGWARRVLACALRSVCPGSFSSHDVARRRGTRF